jgi:hypothetical protein
MAVVVVRVLIVLIGAHNSHTEDWLHKALSKSVSDAPAYRYDAAL